MSFSVQDGWTRHLRFCLPSRLPGPSAADAPGHRPQDLAVPQAHLSTAASGAAVSDAFRGRAPGPHVLELVLPAPGERRCVVDNSLNCFMGAAQIPLPRPVPSVAGPLLVLGGEQSASAVFPRVDFFLNLLGPCYGRMETFHGRACRAVGEPVGRTVHGPRALSRQVPAAWRPPALLAVGLAEVKTWVSALRPGSLSPPPHGSERLFSLTRVSHGFDQTVVSSS